MCIRMKWTMSTRQQTTTQACSDGHTRTRPAAKKVTHTSLITSIDARRISLEGTETTQKGHHNLKYLAIFMSMCKGSKARKNQVSFTRRTIFLNKILYRLLLYRKKREGVLAQHVCMEPRNAWVQMYEYTIARISEASLL